MSELRDDLIAFLADPKAFMATNIVLPPSSPSNKTVKGTGSGIFQFAFEKSDKTGKRDGDAPCAIYRVTNPDAWNASKPRFMAYYCHYDNDNMFDLMLGDEMSLMLTPTMNGCSFGVGSETDGGARRVAHANVSRTSSTKEGIAEQGKTQAEMIGDLLASPAIIGPDKYVDADVYGTTVGVRADGHWSFFMQRWLRPTSSSYVLDRLIDVA